MVNPMGLRYRLRKNAQSRLQFGETIDVVFPAQTISHYLSFLSVWLIVISNARRVVIVTNQRILVCYSGRFRESPIKGTFQVLSRTTPLGPPSGSWYRMDSLGETLYVRRRFHKDIRLADSPRT